MQTCSEGRPFRDLGDRIRWSLDHPESVAVDLPRPVLTELLDELGGDSEPLRIVAEQTNASGDRVWFGRAWLGTDAELEVETVESIMNRVVVQEGDLRPITLLGGINVDELGGTNRSSQLCLVVKVHGRDSPSPDSC